jgi:hypothetical protein
MVTRSHRQVAARLVLDTDNKKTGAVAVTYASIRATCPRCPLQDNGCYAQGGHVRLHGRRLDAANATPERAARDEADAIDGVRYPFGRPLRLHVSGDCRTAKAARLVSGAAGRWLDRGGGPVWTYTHASRVVPREAWGRVSVLASMESLADGARALAAGYAPACVVPDFADGRAFEAHGVQWVPCPEQTRGLQCVDCRLCWTADDLAARRAGIAFAAHGQGRKRVLRVLQC